MDTIIRATAADGQIKMAVITARESVEAQVKAGTLAPTKALSLIAEALDKRFKGE